MTTVTFYPTKATVMGKEAESGSRTPLQLLAAAAGQTDVIKNTFFSNGSHDYPLTNKVVLSWAVSPGQ